MSGKNKNSTDSVSRPGRVIGLVGCVIGLVLAIIGVVYFVPKFKVIGIMWTVVALAMIGFNAYCAFSKKFNASLALTETQSRSEDPQEGESTEIEDRLVKLRSLYEKGLISAEEYDSKRRDILSEL